MSVIITKDLRFYISCRPNGEPPNFLMKACLGMAAGVVGSFVGTPAEVSTVKILFELFVRTV